MDEARNNTREESMAFVMGLIDNRDWALLREHICRWPVAEIADLLSELDKPDRVLLFRVLPRNAATEVFSYLETAEQDELLKELTDEMCIRDRVCCMQEECEGLHAEPCEGGS